MYKDICDCLTVIYIWFIYKYIDISSEAPSPPTQAQLPPIRVCSLRSNRNDSDIYVLLLDPEALICRLLAEDAEAASAHGKPVNPKRHPSRSLSNQDQKKLPKGSMATHIQREVISSFLVYQTMPVFQ